MKQWIVDSGGEEDGQMTEPEKQQEKPSRLRRVVIWVLLAAVAVFVVLRVVSC